MSGRAARTVTITAGRYPIGPGALPWWERDATRMIQRAINRVARTGQPTSVYPLPPKRRSRSVHRAYRRATMA